MSVDTDFYFNLPKGHDAASFVEWLSRELNISLTDENEYGVYSGLTLGLHFTFDPKQDLDDDGDFLVSQYTSNIGITGYAGDGQRRIIQLHHLINIAFAICVHHEINGTVYYKLSQKVIHFGYNTSKDCMWNYDLECEITEFSSLKNSFDYGVKY